MKQKKKFLERIIGFVLSLVMVLSMVPMTAFAGEEDPDNGFVEDIYFYVSPKSNEKIQGYSFDKNTKEYLIEIPDGQVNKFGIVVPDEYVGGEKDPLYVQMYVNGQKTGLNGMSMASVAKPVAITTNPQESQAVMAFVKATVGGVANITYEIGIIDSTKTEFIKSDKYSFNFYKRANIKTLKVKDSSDTEIYPSPTPDWNVRPYVTDYTVVTESETISLDVTVYAGAKIYVGDAEYTSGNPITISDYKAGKSIASIPITVKITDVDYPSETHYTLNVSDKDYSPVITQQPIGVTREKGEKVALSVTATSEEGTLSYQWYDATKNRAINGATFSSFIPDEEYAGERKYKCIVTNTLNTGEVFSTETEAVSYITNLTYLSAPDFIRVPSISGNGNSRIFFENGKPAFVISVEGAERSGSDGYVEGIPYKVDFYRNKINSTDGGELVYENVPRTGTGALDGKNCVEYTAELDPQSITGVWYYYAKVTVAKEGFESVTKCSPTVMLTFKGATDIVTKLEGNGSKENPFLINDIEDLKYVKSLVEGKEGAAFSFEGQHLLLTSDIELPIDWEPIGNIKPGGDVEDRGPSIQPFSGILDGGNHTLVVADHGKSLINFARRATVRNLNIFGEHIDGYGLVERYVVDYGEDGKYVSQYATKHKTINIENVVIKSGTRIQKAGFLGGYASGANDVNIRNCVVEKGVIIGYTKNEGNIGSFAGDFNGTIENSVSYATVYGVDRVGGLVGIKGQSMGACDFYNCSFLGEVIATGDYVGGILGSGYPSAPGTPMAQVHNCYVAANISGNEFVGGITGAESAHTNNVDEGDCYGVKGTTSITDNYYYGKISSSGKYVGGIIGLMFDFTKKVGQASNFFLDTCGAANAVGGVRQGTVVGGELFGLPASAEEFADGTILNKLNNSSTGYSYKNWVQKEKYPEFSDKPVVMKLKVSGEYKDVYFIGEELDLSGITLTAVWSDGKETDVDIKDVEVLDYDPMSHGKQVVTLTVGAAKANISVNVFRKPVEGEDNTITVKLTLLGDDKHGGLSADKVPHTFSNNNLKTWIGEKEYKVDLNATVWDVLSLLDKENDNISISNPTLNYVDFITFSGVKLGEFSNGTNSGWMYQLNGEYPNLGVSEQYLDDGDVIIFHYTDDFSLESASFSGDNDEELDKINAVSDAELKNILSTTSEYLKSLGSPLVGSIGGEWMVIGLERNGETVSADYINAVKAEIENNLDSKTNRLNSNKSTENSRIILALTSMGYDATNFNGTNLVSGLNEMSYLKKQGINGPIWALIALDSAKYQTYGDVTRDNLVDYILSVQLSNGGWSLSGDKADPDMTGMAIQALAPYISITKVKSAVEKALKYLSDIQNSNGSYSSWGTVNSESCAQVVVALTALGINPKTDERFVKNGASVLDVLASFYVEGGGFKHIASSERDGMATEQGFYALVSYYRMLAGKTSLYDMSDVVLQTEPTEPIEYKIIKGSDSKIDLAKLEDTLFTSNADFSKFVKVLVDGKVVDPKYYDAKSGSTKITLKKAYLGTLSVGEHTLTIESTDGSASTKFYIVSAPDTGDKNNVILWGVLAIAMAATLIACIAGLKKRKGLNL